MLLRNALRVLTIVVMGIGPVTQVLAAGVTKGDPTAGEAKALACGGCHGMDGNSPLPDFPKLAGLGEVSNEANDGYSFRSSTGSADGWAG